MFDSKEHQQFHSSHFLAGQMGMRRVPKQNKPFREVYFKPSSRSQDTEILIWLTQEPRLSPSQGQLIIANNTESPSVQKGGTGHAMNSSWEKALCSASSSPTDYVGGSSMGQNNTPFSFPSFFFHPQLLPIMLQGSFPLHQHHFYCCICPPGGVCLDARYIYASDPLHCSCCKALTSMLSFTLARKIRHSWRGSPATKSRCASSSKSPQEGTQDHLSKNTSCGSKTSRWCCCFSHKKEAIQTAEPPVPGLIFWLCQKAEIGGHSTLPPYSSLHLLSIQHKSIVSGGLGFRMEKD